jgi:uncharacterized membrane protein YciS (DUF1049 family)
MFLYTVFLCPCLLFKLYFGLFLMKTHILIKNKKKKLKKKKKKEEEEEEEKGRCNVS